LYGLDRNKKIIIIGGNAAGPAAAAKAKRTDNNADVMMIEAGEFISTGTCELPYVLAGEIRDYQKIVFYSAETFEQEKGVKVLTSHLVEKIDRTKKTITVCNLKTGERFNLDYDKLILCTGSRPKIFSALPKSLSNVFTLKSVSDLIKIKNYISENKVFKALVIGAGYVGVEIADALKSLQLDVTLLDKEPLPMTSLEDETRRLVLDCLINKGVEYIGGSFDIKFNHNGNKFLSIKNEGRTIEYDIVLAAIGFEPNNNLAISSKLEIGTYGGIKVDQKLKTSDPNIYAAGDCIEIVNRITNRPDYIPLATIAHQCGHAAGENAAGGNVSVQPFIKNIAVKIFDKSLVCVGLNSVEAKQNGFTPISVHAITPNIIKVMPNSGNVFGKIIFDKNSGQILGANFFGNNEVIGFGDLICSMIIFKTKAKELANINYNYTPPLSPLINLLSILGRKIERELK
jgi:NADPH-dependent 2,4-dienoyl-CoA reductase/sulfur reductase-like enzyme